MATMRNMVMQQKQAGSHDDSELDQRQGNETLLESIIIREIKRQRSPGRRIVNEESANTSGSLIYIRNTML